MCAFYTRACFVVDEIFSSPLADHILSTFNNRPVSKAVKFNTSFTKLSAAKTLHAEQGWPYTHFCAIYCSLDQLAASLTRLSRLAADRPRLQ